MSAYLSVSRAPRALSLSAGQDTRKRLPGVLASIAFRKGESVSTACLLLLFAPVVGTVALELRVAWAGVRAAGSVVVAVGFAGDGDICHRCAP